MVQTLFEAILLVFVVVLVFLQNWRAALIPMLAVPVSLVGTLAAMFALGYSINNLTLFGMVLAIGIVVDDAIVVVEAVEFHIARGLSPLDATEKAMSEVASAIIGVSLVLVRRVRAGRGHPRADRPVLQAVRGHHRRQHGDLGVQLADAQPGALPAPAPRHHAGKDLLDKALHYLLGWWLFRGFNWTFERGTQLYGRSVGWLIRLAVVVLRRVRRPAWR